MLKLVLQKLQKRLRETYKENDKLKDRLHDATRDAEKGEWAIRREAKLNDIINDKESNLKRVRAERDEALLSLKKRKPDPASTSSELLKQMQGMEAERKMLKEAVTKHQGAAQAIEEAQSYRTKTMEEIEGYKVRVKNMHEQLQSTHATVKDWVDKYNQQVQMNEELDVFIKMAHDHLGKDDALENDIREEIKSSINAQLPAIRTRLAEKLALSATCIGPGEMDTSRYDLENEIKSQQAKIGVLQKELENIRKENTSLREDLDGFWKEMDSVSEAYEASREQNSHLMEMIVKRDEDNARLLSEAATVEREKAQMEEDREDVFARLRHLESDLREYEARESTMNAKIRSITKERDGLQSELHDAKAKLDTVTLEVNTIKTALQSAQAQLDSSQKMIKTLEVDCENHLKSVKMEKTRAERAEALVSKKKGSRMVAEEDAERQALRKMVNCNVCSTRLKDRIITKCNHLFCSVCIDANLSSRHRKCPGCGERFGAGDVKPFYFT